jgi:signal transduction histidine kinase
LPQIPGDAALLGQLLTIFVRNARDAMKPGGELTVQTQLASVDSDDAEHNPEARPGNYACLTVTDAGVGMDDAIMKRLFEPFFTTKALGQGVGLGLATAYGIVQQHHGWIQVASKPGAGTTIKVFLPVAAQPSSHAGPASPRPTTNPGWIARAFQTNAGPKPTQA